MKVVLALESDDAETQKTWNAFINNMMEDRAFFDMLLAKQGAMATTQNNVFVVDGINDDEVTTLILNIESLIDIEKARYFVRMAIHDPTIASDKHASYALEWESIKNTAPKTIVKAYTGQAVSRVVVAPECSKPATRGVVHVI